MSKAKICECAICGEEDLRKNLNDIDDVLVCDYCHQTGEYAMEYEDFEHAAILRALGLQPKIIGDAIDAGTLDYSIIQSVYQPVYVIGGTQTRIDIDLAAQKLCLETQ